MLCRNDVKFWDCSWFDEVHEKNNVDWCIEDPSPACARVTVSSVSQSPIYYAHLKHATIDYAELKRIWDDKVGLTRLLLHTKEFPRATVGTRASIEWLAIQLLWVESWPREQSSDDHPEDALSFHNRIWWSQLEFVTLNLFGGPTTCCPPKALAVCGFLVVTRQWLKIASSWQ